MLKPILNRGGPNIELNALFIQPTRWCGLNCEGCYVKNHDGGEESFHTPWNEQAALFRTFFQGPHFANQITISVDDLHIDEAKRGHMLAVIDSILFIVNTDERPKHLRPEVHMTLHTPGTFMQYHEEEIRNWSGLNMISYSVLSPKFFDSFQYKYWKDHKIPINYNRMVYDTENWEKEIKHLTSIGEKVDHIYLVMNKSPIGGHRDLLVKQEDNNRMRHFMLYQQEVVAKLPDHVRRKLTRDGCFTDTIQFGKTGFGCSSNISRFQVWPDGSVSGCPYAHKGNTEAGHTHLDIVRNIRTGQKQYDFKARCHLPRILENLSKGTRQTYV